MTRSKPPIEMLLKPYDPVQRAAAIAAQQESLMSDDDDAPLLENLVFSTRTANALRWDGLRTIRSVATLTDAELLRIPNIGRGSLKEIRDQIPYRSELAEIDDAIKLDRKKSEARIAHLNKAMMQMEVAHLKRVLQLETVVAKCAAQFKRFAAEARHGIDPKVTRGSNASNEEIMRRLDDALTNDMLAYMCEQALKQS